MSLTPIPEGHVGAVVTFLEMTERPSLPEHSSPSSLGEGDHAQHGGGVMGGGPPKAVAGKTLRLERWPAPDPARYRLLFERIGARWLWYSRLAMDDARLRREMAEVHAVVDASGAEVGLLELDFRTEGECLIRFLGLVPELAGQGHGGWLFAETLALAWRPGVRRVHVNTCTLDHPAALPAYLKAGFTAYRRAFESFPDPRLAGLLPRDSAPQLPLVAPAGPPAS
jgi:GNAT superfamily N-acetyltransferase